MAPVSAPVAVNTPTAAPASTATLAVLTVAPTLDSPADLDRYFNAYAATLVHAHVDPDSCSHFDHHASADGYSHDHTYPNAHAHADSPRNSHVN